MEAISYETLTNRGFSAEVLAVIMAESDENLRTEKLIKLSTCKDPEKIMWFEFVVQPEIPTLTDRIYPRDKFEAELIRYENTSRVKQGFGDIELFEHGLPDMPLTKLLTVSVVNVVGRTVMVGRNSEGVYGVIAEIQADISKYNDLKVFFKATGHLEGDTFDYSHQVPIREFTIHSFYLKPVRKLTSVH